MYEPEARGRAVRFNKIMMNWNLVPGSKEAIEFLMALKSLGINEIFNTKAID